jgi:hypothetical protein
MDSTTLNALASEIRNVIEHLIADDPTTHIHNLTISYRPATDDAPALCELQVTQTMTVLQQGALEDPIQPYRNEIASLDGTAPTIPTDRQKALQQAADALLRVANE